MAQRRRVFGFAGALALGAGLSLVACNAILGIGDARDDPALDTDGGPMADGGDGGGMKGDAGDAGLPIDCPTYCSVIMANCTGINAEYISADVCTDICAQLDPGQPGDMGNSLACRLAHAVKAANDPAECQLGGPLAVGCPQTTPCESFCQLDFFRCNPPGLFPYDGGTKSCETACNHFTYLLASAPDAGDAGIGDTLFLSGDTLNCRLYHLESAFVRSDGGTLLTHCPHTAVDSATCN